MVRAPHPTSPSLCLATTTALHPLCLSVSVALLRCLRVLFPMYSIHLTSPHHHPHHRTPPRRTQGGGKKKAPAGKGKNGGLNPNKTVLPPKKAGKEKSVVAENILWRQRIETEVSRSRLARPPARRLSLLSLSPHRLCSPRPHVVRAADGRQRPVGPPVGCAVWLRCRDVAARYCKEEGGARSARCTDCCNISAAIRRGPARRRAPVRRRWEVRCHRYGYLIHEQSANQPVNPKMLNRYTYTCAKHVYTAAMPLFSSTSKSERKSAVSIVTPAAPSTPLPRALGSRAHQRQLGR